MQLRVTRMGQEDNLGFAIYTTRHIKRGDPIYELIGAMPGDSETPLSGLSSITPHPDQALLDLAPRLLFGPARFINHLCQNFNVEVWKVHSVYLKDFIYFVPAWLPKRHSRFLRLCDKRYTSRRGSHYGLWTKLFWGLSLYRLQAPSASGEQFEKEGGH